MVDVQDAAPATSSSTVFWATSCGLPQAQISGFQAAVSGAIVGLRFTCTCAQCGPLPAWPPPCYRGVCALVECIHITLTGVWFHSSLHVAMW